MCHFTGAVELSTKDTGKSLHHPVPLFPQQQTDLVSPFPLRER